MGDDRIVGLEELFDYSRISSTLGLLFLIVYAPLGLVLFVIRFFIGLHILLITIVLPKHSYLRSIILRPFLAILGLAYVQTGTQHIDPHCKVLVANYTTALDHAVLHLAIPHHLVSVWDYSKVMEWFLGCVDLGARSGREVLVQNAKNFCQSSGLPLLTFPEGESTNGRVGLLKFSSWPFALQQAIQPVTIKITRPLFSVPPSLINSFLLADLFWMLFLPITIFRISFLPVQELTGDASVDSHKIQVAMATDMAVAATSYSSKDKLELIKRMGFERKTAGRREGVRAETVGTSKTPVMSAASNVCSDGASTLKPVFERNSWERHLSFQEKKAFFIETARIKYLEKFSKSSNES